MKSTQARTGLGVSVRATASSVKDCNRPRADVRDPTWNRPRTSGEWVSVSRMSTIYTHFSANDNAVKLAQAVRAWLEKMPIAKLTPY